MDGYRRRYSVKRFRLEYLCAGRGRLLPFVAPTPLFPSVAWYRFFLFIRHMVWLDDRCIVDSTHAQSPVPTLIGRATPKRVEYSSPVRLFNCYYAAATRVQRYAQLH